MRVECKKSHRKNALGHPCKSNNITDLVDTQNSNKRSLKIDYEKHLECDDCRSSKKFCPKHEEGKKKLVQHLVPFFKPISTEKIIEELKLAFEVDNTIHHEISLKIRYLARRKLPRFLLLPILQDLKDQIIPLQIRIILAQAVKHGVRRNFDVQYVEYDELLEVLEGNCPEIKSEIVWALGHKVKNSAQKPSQELINRMKAGITDDINREARSFLESQIPEEINRKDWQENSKNVKISKRNLMTKRIVTKNQQVTKSHQKNFRSQEENLKISSLKEKLKSRQKKVRLNSKAEKLPVELKESKGCDLLFWRGTYVNAQHFYNLAKNRKVIKDKNKDGYLPDKFLDGVKCATGGFLGNLMIDRMITKTFEMISKRQKLNKETIKKLIRLLDDLGSVVYKYYYPNTVEVLARKLFSLSFWKDFKEIMIEKILSSDIPETPQEMKNFPSEVKKIKDLKTRSDSDREKIWKLFLEEVDLIRIDAITALYNCVLRNKEILPAFLTKLENCLGDPNKSIESLAVKILAVLDDSQINYEKVFSSCLRQLEENREREQPLNYVDQQSKDPKRCQELFTEQIVERLSNLLTKSSYDDKFKVDCVEVINNYLEHCFTKGLNPAALMNICSILQNIISLDQEENKTKLNERALISILLTAEKTNELPGHIVEFLVKNIKKFGDYSSNFIIMILATIYEKTEIPSLEEISPMLLDNRVIIGEGETLAFESPSSENSCEIAISAITGQIILSSVKKGITPPSSQVLKNLLDGFASSDKQTRILAAKAISCASDNHQTEFSQVILARLECYFTNNIPDVAIYSKIAYTKILSGLSKGDILLSPNQMEALASVYADEDLVLENEDFSPVVKKNTLSILKNQAKKQEFSEDIMGIFNAIFILDDSSIEVALDIMKSYTESKFQLPESQFKLPESTITAIENALGKPEFASKALNLLESLIENGQAVNDKTLKIFADNLYFNNNDDDEEKLKIKSFKLLEKADENQDLPDEIFEILELERAGREVGLKTPDFEDALRFLEIQTQFREKLPSDVLKALSGQIQNPQILSILINLTTNGQLLPAFMINELSKIFDPENKQLMKIFSNLAKNNQDIPIDLLKKLKKEVGDAKVNIKETLFIFAYWVQRGNKLSMKLIKKISCQFFSTKNQAIKHECLSVFVSILQTHPNLDKKFVQKILIKGLDDENEHIVRTSLKGIDFLCAKETRLNEDYVEVLVRKTVHSTCPDEVKRDIKRLLGSEELTDYQANLLKLATLDCDSEDQLLDDLVEISKKGGNLLERNFQQINAILNKSCTFQEKAIDMLILFVNKNDIPEYMINSIATITLSTSNLKLRDQCLLLVQKIVEIGRVLPEKTVSLIRALQGLNQVLVERIQQNQEIPEVTNLSFKKQWVMGLLTEWLKNPEISKDYIDWLASDLSMKLSGSVIQKLLRSISEVKNLSEFESLIDFVKVNKVAINDIYVKDSSVCDLKKSLEIKLLGNQIKYPFNRFKFATMVDKLLEKDWSFEKLMEMFKKTELRFASKMRAKREQSIMQILQVIHHYKIPVNKFEEIQKILGDEMSQWMKRTNEIAVESCFLTAVKNDVTADFKEMYPSLKDLNIAEKIRQINDKELKSRIDFKNYLSQKGQLEKLKNPISKWTETEISLWAKIIKSDSKDLKSTDLVEALAVINRATFLHADFYLKDVQLISCIVQLNANSEQGRLLQVGTGEGKSTIVSVIAIIHALRGEKVDIITSSPVLAERDAKEKEKGGFYNMFGLSCMDNTDKSLYIKGPKNCYKQDIVYGEIAQFQFDTLRDEYSLLNTLAGRKCEVAIIDEVDSMLIDDSSYIARLSSTIAGMDSLQPLLHFLWSGLDQLQQRLVIVEGKSYLLPNETVEIPKSKEELERLGTEIEGDVEDFLKKQLKNYLEEDLIKKGKVKVPKNFEEFVKNQIPKWIDNAIMALMNQEDHQYIIQEGKIKPVAFDSTGVVQSDTSFGDGLHQLLQRKHKLQMTCETLTTNFLSNIGYIKRYESKLFGLTGTLGSNKTKEVLSKMYNVDLIQIPLEDKKRYFGLPTMVCNRPNEWLEEICESAVVEATKGRGALIICQTIEDCKIVAQKLGERYRAGAIKLYTMNNANQERDIEKINPGEIIVATNLAGRGTDIKADDIEKNGGLHVILTFLPPNQRVEDQAFGRTARQGKCGSGQMILNRTALLQYGDTSPQNIKETRDGFESKMFDEFLENELPIINTKDKLFKKFCELKNKVHEKVKTGAGWLEKIKTLGSSSVYETMLNALEERWALFLHKIDNKIISLSESDKKYADFEEEIWQDFQEEKLIKNPNYHISIANEFLRSSSPFDFKYEQALKHFDHAINLDPHHSAAAFVGKAWLAIKANKKNLKKSQIMNYLVEAMKLLSNEMSLLIYLQTVVKKEDSGLECDLSKQLLQKITILGSYMNSVQKAMTVIRKSRRLIDITGTRSYQREIKFDKKGEDDILREDFSEDVVKTISKFYDIERDELLKQTLKEIGVHDKFTVIFNDLSVFADCGDKDQAIQTINAFDTSQGTLNKLCQKTKALVIEGVKLEDLKKIFDFDTKLNVKKERALAGLKKFEKSDQVRLDSVVGGEIRSSKSLKVEEAMKILEEEKDEELKFNVGLENANKNKNSMFINKEILNDLTLTLEYTKLDCKTAIKRVQEIESKSLQLEISGIKTEISQALLDPSIKYVQLLTPKNVDTLEKVYVDVARKRISEMRDDQIWIKIEVLNNKMAEKLISDCPNAIFQATFIGVNPSYTPEGSNEEAINLSFTKMSSATAKELIPILRKASLEFTLQFADLSDKQLQVVIEGASLQQENLEITNESMLSGFFMENARPNLELSEYAARGIEYVFEINEKRFVPWRSIASVFVLGLVQIALGGVLISTGFGATLGMGLMTEGSADLVTSTRAYFKRSFVWQDYFKQKVVSLAISAVSVGLPSIKDGVKGLQALVSGIKKEALEQAGTQVIANHQAVSTTLIETGKSLKKLAAQQGAVAVLQPLAREGLNQGFETLCNWGLEKAKPRICSFIQNKVEAKFSQESFKILISKMYALDKVLETKSFSNLINRTLQRIICSENNQNHNGWDSIGISLCKGILSDPKNLGSSFSMQTRIIGSLSGLTQVVLMIDNIYSQLFQRISETDKESLSIHQILQQFFNIPLEDAVKLSNVLKTKDVIMTHQYEVPNKLAAQISNATREVKIESNTLFDKVEPVIKAARSDSKSVLSCEFINPEKFRVENIELSQEERHLMPVLKICENLNRYAQAMDLNDSDLSQIMKSISDKITDQIIKVTESHLISPWSSCLIAAGVNWASATIQTNLIKHQIKSDVEEKGKCLQELEAKENKKSEDLNKIAEYKTEIEEKSQLAEKQQITYSDQISYEAKKYTIAYSQCESIYYAQHRSENSKNESSKEVDDYALQVQESKPADLAEMLEMASQHDIKLKIVENADYVLTEEEKKDGVKLVLYTKEGDGVGHYQLLTHSGPLNSNGEIVEISSQGNDSGYEVISAILKDDGINASVGELRQELSEKIQHDSTNSSKILKIRDWVDSHSAKAERKEDSMSLIDEIKNWPEKFKNQEIVEKIINVVDKLNKFGKLAHVVSDERAAPYIDHIQNMINLMKYCAVCVDGEFEILKSGSENGVLTNKFLKDVLHHIARNCPHLVDAISKLRWKPLGEIPNKIKEWNLKKIAKIVKIAEKTDLHHLENLINLTEPIVIDKSKNTHIKWGLDDFI